MQQKTGIADPGKEAHSETRELTLRAVVTGLVIGAVSWHAVHKARSAGGLLPSQGPPADGLTASGK